MTEIMPKLQTMLKLKTYREYKRSYLNTKILKTSNDRSLCLPFAKMQPKEKQTKNRI